MRATTSSSWRTVDIVVAAAIAVAFGVVFWAWGFLWAATAPAFTFLPPAQYLISGLWLVAGIVGALVIRRPGAALFTETVAAIVSVLLGSQWSLDTVTSGVIQGLGAEIVFAAFAYRSWTLGTATLAAVVSAIGEWLHDMYFYYPDVGLGGWLVFLVFMIASAVAIAGIGGWYLTRALAESGVLAPFPSGRRGGA
ncbi:MAG: ECF transporter S component [Chloroflexi bacterium]|nr:ECF transporter S component [Chloroflexota bacterium]